MKNESAVLLSCRRAALCSAEQEFNGCSEVLNDMGRPFWKVHLLPGPIFSCLHENALEAGRHGSADVSLRVVTNHRDILGARHHAFHSNFEKRRRWLAEHGRHFAGSVFESRDEWTRIEA